MSLIKCPECNKEISDKSNICSHCGYPIAEYIKQENQNNNVQSVIAEFPFSVEHSKAEFDGVTNNQVSPSIVDLDVGIKNNTIELVTKLQFNVFCFEESKVDLVEAVTITSPRKPADCANLAKSWA